MPLQTAGAAALDYLPCRYGASKLLFRGPRRDVSKPYIACLGGTETYGKFLEQPFPSILDQQMRIPVINFGCLNAGIDVVLNDPELPQLAARAKITVLQVPGAHNLSNRFYSVHPRRNDRFVAATPMLQTLFRDVDFAGFHFTRHLLGHLLDISPERYAMVEVELQMAWVARMKTLMRRLGGRVILLWIGHHSPDDVAPRRLDDPVHVTRQMLDALQNDVLTLIETVPDRSSSTHGMIFDQTEAPVARGMIGPEAHQLIAGQVRTALEKIL